MLIAAALAALVPPLVTHGVSLFTANGNASRANLALVHAEASHTATSAEPSAPQLAFPLSIADPEPARAPGALLASAR